MTGPMVDTNPPPRARIWSFRVFYVAIVSFVLLTTGTIIGAEAALERYFRSALRSAIQVDLNEGSVAQQIQDRVARVVQDSAWVRVGGVRVDAIVVGADNSSLYAFGRTNLPPPFTDPFLEAERLLPATADVFVSVPLGALLPGGIILAYSTMLLIGMFVYTRQVARHQQNMVETAVTARNESAQRAAAIETELTRVRSHLAEVEPSERAQAQEIRDLEQERQTLEQKLRQLAEREADLRASAQRSTELDEERQALEDLLEEATDDLEQKESEIVSLQDRLKRASRPKSAGGKQRAADALARRLKTLYKNVSVEDRAIQDLLALGDESMRLRAEESIKRLDESPDTSAVRRKVGGLPPHLNILELGFAGKGRIYYSRDGQRYRVLVIGAKNTQNSDLDYLSRLS
ncbi:hypothetical protein MK489_10545 [Myxococcota bacterium]|nr:hypothetical protein [Myxococcota bacterium]